MASVCDQLDIMQSIEGIENVKLSRGTRCIESLRINFQRLSIVEAEIAIKTMIFVEIIVRGIFALVAYTLYVNSAFPMGNAQKIQREMNSQLQPFSRVFHGRIVLLIFRPILFLPRSFFDCQIRDAYSFGGCVQMYNNIYFDNNKEGQ